MRRRTTSLVFVVALCLLGTSCLGQASKKTRLQAEFKRLDRAYTRAQSKFLEPYQKAKTVAEQDKIDLDMDRSPFHRYLPRFRSLELRARGTTAGANAMAWMLSHAYELGPKDRKISLTPLTRDYIRSPLLEQKAAPLQNLAQVFGLSNVDETLQVIAKKSPSRKVRASALYSLSQTLKSVQQGQLSLPTMKRELAEMKKTGKESAAAIRQYEDYILLVERARIPEDRALHLLQTVAKEYADTAYAKMAANGIFEIEHLSIGKEAPDFEATDQDGKHFKLSEYRGKVVVLDFWGFW